MDDLQQTNDDATAALRRAVHAQLGVERPDDVSGLDVSRLPRFGADLPDELTPERRKELLARARDLDPWLQGPFHLGGDLIIGGTWRNDARWEGLGRQVPEDLRGASVLDVGSNAGYDPFMFKLRGAGRVLACEPFAFIEQARFLESVYRTGIEIAPLGWQDLDPTVHGRFDLVHCHGVLYHELHPAALLQRLRTMVSPGGTLLFGSMMLADPELSEYARFVPNAYYGDRTWWWVPGRLAMRWLLEACGFELRSHFGVHSGPPGEFETINGYFECLPGEPPREATYTVRS